MAHTSRTLTGLIVAMLCMAAPSLAETGFTGVAAGDPTADSAILWTRTIGPDNQPVAVPLTAQIATDPAFHDIVARFTGQTDTARAGTVKIDATGLKSHTHYYYRFVAADGTISPGGRFTTAPAPDAREAVRFGFSGDANGAWRPYPVLNDFADSHLDYFIFLGDTMYETASTGSPAAADSFASPQAALADYRRKYLENIQPVHPGGFPGLQAMFAAQGNYTLLDNHELGNRQFISGGAPAGHPPGKGADQSDPANDVNASCDVINRTPGFAAMMQAYLDFQPVRERLVSAPADCRSDHARQLYFAQRWGANSIFINVDDRSFRDIQMKTPEGKSDTGARADNPGRTILGVTQFQWLTGVLAEAQREGVIWKIVAISSPIEPVGPMFDGDGMKSWIGGYRAERNRLLKFIADNHIEHVVFLTTDDHVNRVQEITYLTDPANPASRTRLPGAFTIVAGPIGAGGPDQFTAHDYDSIKATSEKLVEPSGRRGSKRLGCGVIFRDCGMFTGRVIRKPGPAAGRWISIRRTRLIT